MTDLSGEMGRLIVAISAAIESLPGVGRAHLGVTAAAPNRRTMVRADQTG